MLLHTMAYRCYSMRARVQLPCGGLEHEVHAPRAGFSGLGLLDIVDCSVLLRTTAYYCALLRTTVHYSAL